MGEDITKLKKNIDNIKKMVEGGRKDDTKKEGSTDTREGDKRK